MFCDVILYVQQLLCEVLHSFGENAFSVGVCTYVLPLKWLEIASCDFFTCQMGMKCVILVHPLLA